jgi:hypothetical protein
LIRLGFQFIRIERRGLLLGSLEEHAHQHEEGPVSDESPHHVHHWAPASCESHDDISLCVGGCPSASLPFPSRGPARNGPIPLHKHPLVQFSGNSPADSALRSSHHSNALRRRSPWSQNPVGFGVLADESGPGPSGVSGAYLFDGKEVICGSGFGAWIGLSRALIRSSFRRPRRASRRRGRGP